MSEPKGRGADWTEERRRSDEGRKRLEGGPEASGEDTVKPPGAARRDRRASGNMIIPATRFRTAAISSGGIVSTPTLMARYVLPHTT
jgi:hypothetical protein